MATAIYAGSFDPITNGHVWVVKQALKMFDKVYVAIGINADKRSTFSIEDRKAMIVNAFPNEPKIEIISFDAEFLVNVCRQNGIDVMIRGIRNVKDFEYEKQIQDVNERIYPQVQTVYLVPPNDLAGLSSSMVKGLVGIAEWQFVVQDMIPKANMSYMMEKAYSSKEVAKIMEEASYYMSGDNSVDVKAIISRYNSEGRFYHTIQHISEMLNLAKEHGNQISNHLLFLAIIFHDLVYDPKSNTNEEDSVKAFEDSGIKLSEANANHVKKLIMVTKNHMTDKSDWQNLMVDMDLAILGSDMVRFNEYERQIRNEYGFVSDELYNAGRLDFVKKLLSRPTIYLTKTFQEKYEAKARENLNKLVFVLEKK